MAAAPGDSLGLARSAGAAAALLPNISLPSVDHSAGLSNYSSPDDNFDAVGSFDDFMAGMTDNPITQRDILPEELPAALRTFFLVSYTIIILISVAGNSLVIVVVAKNSKMRTVTNTFLVSLAVSDMLIAVVNMPFQLKFHLQNEWTMGEALCKFSTYLQGAVIVTSILTLTGIAIDRWVHAHVTRGWHTWQSWQVTCHYGRSTYVTPVSLTTSYIILNRGLINPDGPGLQFYMTHGCVYNRNAPNFM